MKKLKNFLLPAVIILIGAGAAFATSAAKNSLSAVEGYRFDSARKQCVDTKQCSTVPGDICTWTDPSTSVTYNLHNRISSTMCGNQTLYEPATR